MDETFPHLSLQREVPVNEKRSRNFVPPPPPADIPRHGRGLLKKLANATEEAADDIGGFDDRKLFRFTVQKEFNPDNLRKIATGIEFVSQENETVVIGFATNAALASFEARLSSMVSGRSITNKEVIYALQSIDGWGIENRTGWALKNQGFPTTDYFLLDVELWPLEDNQQERAQEWAAFESWLTAQEINKKDQIKKPELTLYRVECNRQQAEQLLRHRDIRSVDLPPNFGLERSVIYQDVQQIPETPDPTELAPSVVVLDSGLASGHPLLKAAVREAKSFLPGEGPHDEHGHGTHVAGLALYGDFEKHLRAGNFIPSLRLFSGRILDKDNENTTGFVENHIEEAVRYFVSEHQCKVFNLSFGDANKPYLGGHLKGLSVTLDILSREFGVLFVVAAGNHRITEDSPDGIEWRDNYPHYLVDDAWRIIEPAPALNVLTVGSLARTNQTYNSQRYPLDPAEIPAAQPEQFSPFTRSGLSIDGAIKPELVAYGGNWALNARASYALLDKNAGLGVVSTGHQFVRGHPFAVENGTSMAAPQVAHLAASVLITQPNASTNLIRALLCNNAAQAKACTHLIEQATKTQEVEKKSINAERKSINTAKKAKRPYSQARLDELNERIQQLNKEINQYQYIGGYGQVNETALHRSLESAATLTANGSIENKRHHFYEIPIPGDFTSSGKRLREIAVALAYTPPVRSTRIKYRATRIDFKLVYASDLEEVTTTFNKATSDDDYQNITEVLNPQVGQTVRSKGTVQADVWQIKQLSKTSKLRNEKLFVVVTRNDFPWGENLCSTEEEYALVVSLRDTENVKARLYSQIQTQLKARLPTRVKL